MLLSIRIVDPADVLKRYSHVRIDRAPQVTDPITGDVSPGTFAEITTPSSRRPLIEEGKLEYEYDDPAGADTSYYRISYYNAKTGRTSTPSLLNPPGGDPALTILSVEDLKRYFMFGLDLTNDFGEAAEPEFYAFYIRAAVSWLEMYLDVDLTTKVRSEMHDITPREMESFMLLRLRHFPVQSITNVQLKNNGSVTREWSSAVEADATALRLDRETGQLNVYPGYGGELGGYGSPMWPQLTGRRFIPHEIEVNYVSGWPEGGVPAKLREVVGKLAAMGPLNVFGDITLGAGLQAQSLSLDGLSQSVTTTNSSTNAGFGARLILYAKELKTELPILRRQLHPVGLFVC